MASPVSKAWLRDALIDRRRNLPPGAARAAGEAIAGRLLDLPALAPGHAVAAFWPLEGELDTRPVIEGLAARGHPVALPRMAGSGASLAFLSYVPGDVLVEGRFRVMEPSPERPPVRPDLVLVPLLAFDRRGGRLGYGAGFYDRTLRSLRADGAPVIAAGLAFAAQEVDEVPMETHDEALDFVLTEREVIRASDERGR